jgi:hopanoid biosynthesis associated protein HpnK
MTTGESNRVRYLILNADDFGYSEAVNKAVLRAHLNGALTSASLMVTEPAFEQAVEMARGAPGLGVGLHVSVSFDHALLKPDQIPSLVGPDGRFGVDPFRVGIRYAFARGVQAQLLLEMEAQFKRFAGTGLLWSHADGHQHFHLHPAIWSHFMDLCDAYSVGRIRLPHEGVLQHLRSDGDRTVANIAGLLAFRALRKRAKRDLERRTRAGRRYFVCDRVYGMLQTGNMNLVYMERLLSRLEGVTNEIYFHPGSPNSGTTIVKETDSDEHDVELAALLDPNVARLTASHSIQTGSYSEVDLMHAAGAAYSADSCLSK